MDEVHLTSTNFAALTKGFNEVQCETPDDRACCMNNDIDLMLKHRFNYGLLIAEINFDHIDTQL